MKSTERWRRILWVAAFLAVAVAAACYFRPIEVAAFVTRARLRLQGEHSHYVVIAGNRVHYREMGSGTPLVLIHGLGGSSLDWAPAMPVYARAGYHVYAPDLLGFGKSDAPDIPYSIEDQTQMLRQFFADEIIQQADVAGWSMGGWVALKFTLENPTLVRRLVVNDSAGLKFQVNFPADAFNPANPAAVNRLARLLEPKGKWVPNFVARDFIRRLHGRHGWVISRAMASMMTGNEVLDGKLSAIQQPVLVVWGADDGLIPVSSGYDMEKAIPQADLDVFTGCGHLAPALCSRAVSAKTLDFLEAAQPPRGVVETIPGH